MAKKKKSPEKEAEEGHEKPKKEDFKPRPATKIPNIEREAAGELKYKSSHFVFTGKMPLLETEIDELYRWVREEGSIRLSRVAKRFGISKDMARDWGEMLEEHKVIRLHYPLFGEPSFQRPDYRPFRKKRKKKETTEKEIKPISEPGKPLPKRGFKMRFTKKRIFIMTEIVVLSELLIYIFLVNKQLAINFLPTIQFHINNIPYYFWITMDFFARNPLYLVLASAAAVMFVITIIYWAKRGKGWKKHMKKKEASKLLKTLEEQKKRGLISKGLYEKMKKKAEKRTK